MTVHPQVQLGDAVTGLDSDHLRLAFGKFNTHTHSVAIAPNLLLYGIKPGDVVTSSYFPSNTIVSSISPNTIILSQNSYQSVSQASLTFSTKTYSNFRITLNSPVISLNSQFGFVGTEQLVNLSYDQTSSVLYPENNDKVGIMLASSFDGYLHSLSLQNVRGVTECSLFIQDRLIVSLGLTQAVQTHYFLHNTDESCAIDSGQSIYLSCSTNSSNSCMSYNLTLFRKIYG